MILQYSSIWYASNAFENLLYQTMHNYFVLIYLEPKTQITPKISCHRIDYLKVYHICAFDRKPLMIAAEQRVYEIYEIIFLDVYLN